MKTQSLPVDLLIIDAGTQSRVAINEDTVGEYAELIAEHHPEWPLGPLDVFHDGSQHLVADGFHRTLAAARTKRSSIPCRVHKGSARDARIFGMTANDRHGLRMSRADKRACVEWLLDDGVKLTQAQVAELAGVSRRTVAQIVADRKPQIVQTSHRSGGGGDPFDDAGDDVGEDARMDSESGTTPQESTPEPPRNGKEKPGEKPTEKEQAQQSIERWSDAVGRWMTEIDDYRDRFPGPKGDHAIEAAKKLFNALVTWRKGL